jgi:pimeloyl-ACP methyl ester carboxylesterase
MRRGADRLSIDFDLALPSGRIRARRWGSDQAPLLLCVPGLSANLAAFGYLAERLAGEDRQVVAIDLRGCGRSETTPPGSYGLDSHASDVLGVADALGVDRFDVAGWSLGALIVMTVALRERARLRTVTLIDHAGPTEAAALVPIREGLARLDIVVATPDDYLRKVRRAGLIEPWSPLWDDFYTYELGLRPDGSWTPLTSRAAAEEDLNQPWPRDWTRHWCALAMPAVVVRAVRPLNDAWVVPESAVAALRAANPSVQVVDTPQSNHFTCMVDPVTVAAMTMILEG